MTNQTKPASGLTEEYERLKMKLNRSIERWRNCEPSAMAEQSEAAIMYAFEDAKHDILALSDSLAALLSAQSLKEQSDKQYLISKANSFDGIYGEWKDHPSYKRVADDAAKSGNVSCVANMNAWIGELLFEVEQLKKDIETMSGNEEDRKDAIKTAYGYLWHVNAANDAPAECNVLSITPEEAAYKARRVLRDLLTHEQIGEGINEVRAAMQEGKQG